MVPLVLAGLCLLFIAAIGMPLQFVSNQNTKFLHGMATAFPDRLGADWTAQTVDGLPVFTALVHGVAAYVDPAFFYVIEALLLCVMCVSLLAIARRVAPDAGGTLWFLIVVGGVLVALVHPPQEDTLRGVAGQYMTHGYLQPSEFGILYLPALLLAARRHPAALILGVIPAAVHPAYIAFSAILLGVFLFYRWRDGSGIPLLTVTVAVAILVVPPIDLALRFAPTDAEVFAQANNILAFERIPHHSDPSRWATWPAYRKLIIALMGIAVAPSGVIRTSLVCLLGLAVGGTVFVAATGNAEVALMAPWRASIIVVPVTATIVIGWIVNLLYRRVSKRSVLLAVPVIVTGYALFGAYDGLRRVQAESARNKTPDYVIHIQESHDPQDIYLTHPRMSDFRLAAMTSQFVTWKTHPYLDTEVLEWKRRSDLAQKVFGDQLDCDVLAEILAAYPVTHVLAPVTAAGTTCGLPVEFKGEEYRILVVGPDS